MILLSAVIYTIYKLTSLFGNEFSKESKRMTFILIIYAVAFVSKSAYQWYMFSLHLSTGN